MSSAWSGRCFTCGEWQTLELSKTPTLSPEIRLQTTTLKQAAAKDLNRFQSKLGEFDAVLGGGLVAGSVNLITGQPGIGKSTLLLQIAAVLAEKISVLYASGEESAYQISLRAKRLGLINSKFDLVSTNSSDAIAAAVASKDYQLVIIDSIQTIASDKIPSSAGNPAQITGSANLLISNAKSTNTSIILVGHVTKEGIVAGPKILEHLVDAVIQLEGEKFANYKILRTTKNRYGPTDEVALFEMTEKGMIGIDNPSSALLAQRELSDGSVVTASIEGTRAILVEVQALVNPSKWGYPKRTASGFDINRLNLLIAVLERRTSLKLSDSDVFINIVGGIKLSEPAADLAICMAIASAAKQMKLVQDLVVWGEVGLSGSIRHANFANKRLKEALKLGFIGAIGPLPVQSEKQADFYAVNDLKSALNRFLKKS